jgi:serine protease Do
MFTRSARILVWTTTVAAVMACAAPVAGANDILHQIENAYIDLAEQIRPVVVRIETKGSRDARESTGVPDGDQLEEFFRRFGFEPPEGMRPRRLEPQQATGSGFIYDNQGHIVTNNHVVSEAGQIVVELANGRSYPATIVGKDPSSDIAVLKIEPDGDLPVARLGSSGDLRVGQFAVAMGSARGLRGSLSLSFGHVTALQREGLNLPNLRFQSLIQTDAAINLGNSGGPLCNIDGEIIGINVAIVWGANSIGFAIPIDRAKNIVPTLISEGRMAYGYLGVQIKDVEQVARETGASISDFVQAAGLPDARGAYIDSLIPQSPAEKSGLKVDDIIRKVGDTEIASATDLTTKISEFPPGSTVPIEVWRERNDVTIEVTLGEFPDNIERVRYGAPVFGMSIQNLTEDVLKRLNLDTEMRGVLVMDVESKSPADDAGIFRGDIIQKVDYEDVTDGRQFRELVNQYAEPGKSLLVRIHRPSEGSSMPKIIKVPQDFQKD